MRYQTLFGAAVAAAMSISQASVASANSLLPIDYTLAAASTSGDPDIVITGRRWQPPKPAPVQWETYQARTPSKPKIHNAKSAALRWEMAYLALSAIDTFQTIECLERGICQEANPLFGKNPSATKLVLAKVGAGLVHFYAFKHTVDRSPKTALRFAQVSAAIQGSVVLLNARFTFK